MPESLEDFLNATLISAPSPQGNGEFVSLSVASGRVQELARLGRHNDIFGLVYNLFGILPPVNNIGYHERDKIFADHWGGLRHAHAIFQGLRRPFHDENHDTEVYIYVVAPKYVYEYAPDMVCVARRIVAPSASVFVAYVKFDRELESGVVINWEWVVSDAKNLGKPRNFNDRYDKLVWENG